jgi:septum formation protein
MTTPHPSATISSPVDEASVAVAAIHRIVLASSSPRRHELITHLGVEFRVVVPDVDETPLPDESPAAMVERLANLKARAVQADPDELIVAADTTIELDGAILGKPDDPDHAHAMLTALRGRTHLVHTGVAVRLGSGHIASSVDSAQITMADADDGLIRWYVATGEPMGKAGSYAVQGIGGLLVARVDGNIQTVIGLPNSLVISLAAQLATMLPEQR